MTRRVAPLSTLLGPRQRLLGFVEGPDGRVVAEPGAVLVHGIPLLDVGELADVGEPGKGEERLGTREIPAHEEQPGPQRRRLGRWRLPQTSAILPAAIR
jgi:hypothetical protein